MNTTTGQRGVILTNNWSIQYDGRSVFELMFEKAKCSFEHAKMVIEGEGGYIDDNGIIHKGTAENKLAEID